MADIRDIAQALHGGMTQQSTFSMVHWQMAQLEQRYGVCMHLHDTSGKISAEPDYESTLAPYRYHNNAFCNRVKQAPEGFQLCVKQKERLVAHCRKTQSPFFGVCPMGVGELVMPLWWQNQLLGILSAGFFVRDRTGVRAITSAWEMQQGAEPGALYEIFEQLTSRPGGDAEEFLREMSAVARLLVLHSGKQRQSAQSVSVPQEAMVKGWALVQQAQHFIRTYFAQDLTVSLIASWCYCHPNYLSTAFHEKTGKTVSEFIRQVRIEKAAELLDITGDSVSDIAASVGIPDANYFSVVFKTVTGYTPRAYRNRKPENI